MIDAPHKRRDLGTARNSAEVNKEIHHRQFISFARKIGAALLAALIFAASVWSSVFGMAADLAAGPHEPVIYQADRLAVASGRLGE